MLIDPLKRKEERRADIAARLVLIFWILLIVAAVATQLKAQPQPSSAERFVSDFLRIYPARKKKALTWMPALHSAAEKTKLSPLLLALNVASESAWRDDVIGKGGEIGLSQIMPNGLCAAGQDLTTPAGQLLAGARCLRRGVDTCGELQAALNWYLAGTCFPKNAKVWRRSAYRVERYLQLQKIYE